MTKINFRFTNNLIVRIAFAFCVMQSMSSSAQQKDVLPANFDNYVQRVLQTFEVPGISLAVVKDGKVLLTKGYGIKRINKSERVNEHTLFPIASNSKAFTASALAILVEEGKIKWDAPVIDYLPWFRLGDTYTTGQITVKDLLVHRSGIGAYAGDLLQFPPTTFTRKEIVKKAQFLPIRTGFRYSYAYDNILYLVAGELIETITGMSWEEFIKARILQPVGMTGSITRISTLKNQGNYALPHARFNGEVKEVTNFFTQGVSDLTNPAGGIASNAVDMSKWLLTQLDSGTTTNGSVLFKPTTTTELWKGVTPMPVTNLASYLSPAQMEYQSYALGFYTYNYRSARVVGHGGKLDGFVSRVFMVPSLRLGIAVLTNQEAGGAWASIVNHITDHFLKISSFDWIGGYKKAHDEYFKNADQKEQQAAQVRNSSSKPSLQLNDYSGIYTDPWYGQVRIDFRDGKLYMDFTHTPGMTGIMEHWQYDTFIVRWANRELKADAYITFSLNPDGSIERIKMKAISPLTDPSYDFHDLSLTPLKSGEK